MRVIFLVLLVATRGHAYWYPNSYTRTPSPEEDCYSQANDPYSITCHATNDFVYAPCSDLFIPSTPIRPNNFTYYAVCTFPNPYLYDEADFWSDIITVEVCENYWDACISDNPLAKYDDSIIYGKDDCMKVTDKACGNNRVDEFSIPGSEPEDTTLGAFDLGPYSTASQVTLPRISMATETGSVVSEIASSTSRIVVGSTTTSSQISTSSTSMTAPTGTCSGTSAALQSSLTSSAIAQVTTASKATRGRNGPFSVMATSVAWMFSMIVLILNST